jgi:hypothetical protein
MVHHFVTMPCLMRDITLKKIMRVSLLFGPTALAVHIGVKRVWQSALLWLCDACTLLDARLSQGPARCVCCECGASCHQTEQLLWEGFGFWFVELVSVVCLRVVEPGI